MIPLSAKSSTRIFEGFELGSSSPQPQVSMLLDGSFISGECQCRMMASNRPLNPKFLQGIGMHTTVQIPAGRKHRRSESTGATEIGFMVRQRSLDHLQQSSSSLPRFSMINRYGMSSSEQARSSADSGQRSVLPRTDKSVLEQRPCSKVQSSGQVAIKSNLNTVPISIARRIRLCKRTVDLGDSPIYPVLRECSIQSIIRGVAPSSNPKVKLHRLDQKD